MLETVRATIEQYRLLPDEGHVVVAVSGGADSLCLLHLLHRLCGPGTQFAMVQLHVAHLNHQLRGETSEQDAVAVAEIARRWELPVTIGRADVPALARAERRSIEEAARVARYRFLREVAQGQPIAVAHHQDDQVETLLLHWLRGGGLASMVGLQPRQQDIIRPLLNVTHAETVAYCQSEQLQPLEDLSNNDPHFLRNRIRHELIPLLTTLNPGMQKTLLRTAEVMQSDLTWIEEQVDQCWSEVVVAEQEQHYRVSVDVLLTLPVSLQRHLLRRITASLCDGQSPLELRHYRLLEELLHRESSNRTVTLHLPQGIYVTRINTTVTFANGVAQPGHAAPALFSPLSESEGHGSALPAEALLPIPGTVIVPGTHWIASAELLPDALLQEVLFALVGGDWERVWRLLPQGPHIVYIDAEKLSTVGIDSGEVVLRVRTRREGDRIQPLGMAHEKKVQDVLVDKHIPRPERAQIPFFFTAEQCVWLAGVQIDHRVRLTRETGKIVRLSIQRDSL